MGERQGVVIALQLKARGPPPAATGGPDRARWTIQGLRPEESR